MTRDEAEKMAARIDETANGINVRALAWVDDEERYSAVEGEPCIDCWSTNDPCDCEP